MVKIYVQKLDGYHDAANVGKTDECGSDEIGPSFRRSTEYTFDCASFLLLGATMRVRCLTYGYI